MEIIFCLQKKTAPKRGGCENIMFYTVVNLLTFFTRMRWILVQTQVLPR